MAGNLNATVRVDGVVTRVADLLTTFNVQTSGGAGTGTVTSVTASSPLTGGTITTTGTIGLGVVGPTLGGTGLATLTAHAVMVGAGTGNVAFATVGTTGRPLIDQGGSADPAFLATGVKIDSHFGVITTDSPTAGAVTCNCATSDKHKVTAAVSTTVTFSNLTAGQIVILKYVQGGSGSNTLTVSPSPDWGTAGAPTLSTTVGKVDILTFFYDGTTLYGGVFGLGFSA